MENRLLRVSASQAETFLRCPRAWYNGSILGDREPQKPHQKKGEDVHAELEHFGKTGEVRPSEYLEIVQVALDYLGEHKHVKDPYWEQFQGGAGLLLEQEILMPTYEDGPSWIGYIDRVVAMPDKGEVWDYKTTSDFRYAKTPEELLETIQMQSYAHWLFSMSDYKECLIKHLCLRMRGRAAAKPVEAVTTRERTEAFWNGKILPLVREMAEWAKLRPVTAEPLPPHTDHCNDYGGCFYRTKCGFTTTGTRSFEKMSENSLLQQMLAQAGAVGVAAPAILTPTVEAPAIPTPAVAAPVSPEAFLASLQKPAAPVPAPTVTLGPVTTTGAMDLNALMGMLPPAPAAPAPEVPVKITPDTFPPITTHAVPTSATTTATATATTTTPTSPILAPDATSRVSTPEEVGPPPALSPSPETAPEAGAAAEAPKKKGRPKKAATADAPPAVLPGQQALPGTAQAPETAPAAAPEAPASVPTNPVAAVDLAAVSAPAPSVPAAPVLESSTTKLMTADDTFRCGVEVLFVDAFPQKGWPYSDRPYHLDDFMHAFTRLAAASAKQADYALIPYGGGRAYLRTAIRILMHALPKVVVVNTATAGAAEFLEVVTPYAKLIVRGTR